MIQTESKQKLPKGHSYPIGANTLSDALIGVPQYELIKLCFWYKDGFRTLSYNKKLKEGGKIEILRAEHTAPFYDWRIHIMSVPSSVKHEVGKAMLAWVLPALRENYRNTAAMDPSRSYQCLRATVSLDSGNVQVYS